MKEGLVAGPSDENELAEAVANADGPLCIKGGGTRRIGAPVAGTELSLAGLSGITLYEPEALTIVARAGTPVAEIEVALSRENQRLPFEPMDHRPLLGTEGTPTIGGVVAANVSGPRRIAAGACRDSLIGVRYVDGAGTIVKNGGRVMKNVTGYDLVKLMAGSYGTLGVLSEVSFKLLPANAAGGTVMVDGLSPTDAVSALATALGSPFEVSGAAHIPEGPDGAPVTMLRVEGFETQVTYRTAELSKLLSRFGVARIDTDPASVAKTWADIRDVTALAGTLQDIWRISVKPTDGARVAEALEGAKLLLDWGGGLVWAGVAPRTDVRAALMGIPGHATLMRPAPGTAGAFEAFHPEPPAVAAIASGLRQKFDPRGILNPGLMG
ncbi:MAG: FAD-binding protein [Pseudomonadota bacterium]